MRHKCLRTLLVRGAALLLIAGPLLTPDEVHGQAAESGFSTRGMLALQLFPGDLPEGHSPRGALLRSLAVPGWGQWYNRQYYKIPIVYAGLAGLTYATLTYNDGYIVRRRALLYHHDSEQYAQFEPEFNQFESYFGGSEDLLRQQRDAMRRNRDLFIIITGAWWALATVEAYVSAHLIDFDVDEDLSLSVHPAWGGISARLKVQL